MFFATILSALLLAGFLFWCKRYFFRKNKEVQPQKKYKKYFDVLIIVVISFVFVGTKYLIDYFVNTEKVEKTTSSYLDSNEQFKIGKAFYLGKGLPKDDSQALMWLLLAAENGNKDALELVHLFGYDVSGQSGDKASPTGVSTFAVDIIPANKINTKLSDIAGMKEAKEDVKQFLDFIKDPEKFEKIGARPPKGIMMYGPPGTGKTMIARAIAGEANATFISASGAAFEESYVGTGAARVRELFKIARKNKPAIIFIDEIDALAPARGTENLSMSHIQTVNQLLSEMENVDTSKNKGIFVIAATNRLEAIDNALLRPGRFDWQIHINLPTDEDRKEILTKMLKKIKVSDIDIDKLVENSAGYSGADLSNLVNEAAIIATKNDKKAVDMDSFQLAFNKIATYEKDLSPTLSIKILSPNEVKTQFSDIAGMNEAKKEVTEVVDFLKSPKEFTRLGAKPPGGIIIYGPPGTGKTLMARAIAGEAKVNFLAISGSAFDERYVGVGASRVRELFKLARKYKPCIVFIDEIDALAPTRNPSDISGNDQTLNQFLNEMDNIQKGINEGIIFIGATNRLDIIDPAVLRPGRFDRKVFFRLPTIQEREEILQVHMKNIKVGADVSLKKLAQTTTGFSGADLANLVNEAAIEATRKNKDAVDMKSFEEANDKIILGVNMGSGSYTEQERKLTAYHEAGHALVGLLHPDHPRAFHKMTIGLRGSTLGATHFRVKTEEYSWTKKQLEALICTSLGGYVAEELIFGKDNVTTGASSDLINANEIVKKMVTKYAMSDNQSLIVDDVISEGDVAKNAEIILKRDYDIAKDILQKNMDKLHLLANALLEKETLDYEQIVELLKIKKL
ncbi:MAG: ATP-dependent zinc metalloprotease FtsH [Gammaproteobacteria bacterium]|jgi:cell division protease FtsH|nr:ATP-dependent zinc metalloprotease FtsH [Gammaproteobacteria bacterium]